MFRRLWLVWFVLTSPATTLAAIPPASNQLVSNQAPRLLEQREQQVFRALTRAAEFVTVPHLAARRCEDLAPPEALTTPDPLFVPAEFGGKVRVSFIVGTDGRVHSPLILESAGLAGDRRVLATVRTWRYRPATCNGIPTETEGKVEFSNR